jgi:hypothetical protein
MSSNWKTGAIAQRLVSDHWTASSFRQSKVIALGSIVQNENRCEQLFTFLTFFAFRYALFAASSVLFIGEVQT